MWRAKNSGVFAGMGRAWRARVRVDTCAACYGSGGGTPMCPRCEGTGSVFVDKRDGALIGAAKWTERAA